MTFQHILRHKLEIFHGALRVLTSVALTETHGSPLQGLDLSVWDDQELVDGAC